MNTFPPLTKARIETVDLTPDAKLPLRIIEAYLENCDVNWSSTDNSDPLCQMMNEHNAARKIILERARKVLIKDLSEHILDAVFTPL